MKRTKARLYARFSPRPDDHLSESIEVQLEAMREFCAARNWYVAGEYADRALSGADDSRKALGEAIKDLGRKEKLVVFRLNRIARDEGLFYALFTAIKGKGGSLVSIAGEGTEDESDTGMLAMGISTLFAAHQKRSQARYTSIAMKAHQKRGRAMGGSPPYGMMIDKDNPIVITRHGREEYRGRLIPNPKEQEAIARIMTLAREKREAHEKINYSEIGRQLDAEGFKARAEKGWSSQQIRRIIKAHDESKKATEL